jgi:hypothetical protein
VKYFPKQYVAVSIAVFLSFILIILRTFYGFDPYDEGFYYAAGWRLILGDRLFVDELHVTQSVAAITVPVLKSLYWWKGDLDGAVLFMRWCYLLVASFSSTIIFYSLRKYVGWIAAAFLALLNLTFVPMMVPTLSYNSLGMHFFNLGVLGWLYVIERKTSKWGAMLTGIAHGFATIAHPILAFPSIVAAAIAWVLLKQNRRYHFTCYLGAATLMAAYLFYWMGWRLPVSEVLAFDSAMDVHRKLDVISALLVIPRKLQTLPSLFLLFPGLGVTLWLGYRFPIWGMRLILVGIPVMIACAMHPRFGGFSIVGYIQIQALLAPFFLYFLRKESWAWVFFWVLWCPAILSGLSVAAISHVAFTNSANGFLLACLVSDVYLIAAARKRLSSASPFILSHQVIVLLFFLLNLRLSWNETIPNVFTMKGKLTSGPYRGINIDPRKAELLSELEKDVRQWEKAGEKMLIEPLFPAGYLFSKMRPAFPTTWDVNCVPETGYAFCEKYYSNPANRPYLLIHFNSETHGNFFQNMADNFYERKATRALYSVYVRKNGE